MRQLLPFLPLAAAFLTPVLVAFFFERVSQNRCLGAAKRLLSLAPKTARVRRNGLFEEAPAASVMPEELLEIREDERFPADGVVVSGFGAVDEQPLTGDEKASDKRVGDKVFAGTQNLSGPLTIRAIKTGSATVVAQLADMLRNIQGRKSSAANKAAAFSATLFSRLSFVAALCVFGFWWFWQKELNIALLRACAVLLAAYPFALKPGGRAVFNAAMLSASKKGILLRGPESLTQASRADTLLFCKTGALASGPLTVTDVTALPGFFEEELLTYAAAAEKASPHPFAQALLAYMEPEILTGAVEENTVRTGSQEFVTMRVSRHGFIGSSLPPAERFEEVSGHGVRAVIGGRAVIAGDIALLKAHKIDTRPLENILFALEREGKTAAAVAINGKAAGVIAAALPLKAETSAAVGKLIQQGIECYLLTGGGAKTANALAKRAGILNVLAGVSAAKKSEGVFRAQQIGRTVAVAGDEIRDAEALGAADIAVCMGTAGPGRAGVGIVNGDLGLIPVVFYIAQTTAKRLRQNLILYGICSAVGAALAAFGLFSPIAAGVFAGLVSAAVLWNAGRF